MNFNKIIIRKVRTGLIILLIVIQSVAILISSSGFSDITKQICLMDDYLYKNWPDVIYENISDDYSLQQFMKDSTVNGLLYKDIATLFFVLTTIMIIAVLICSFLIGKKNRCLPLRGKHQKD
jgi:hypothetical protein